MCLTFKEPLLQIRLKKENLPVWLIGIVFSMDTITYTITSFFLNFVNENDKNFLKLVFFGQCLYVLSMVFQGPMPGILPDKVVIIGIGILFGGIGGALTNNNCVPALNQTLAGLNIRDKSQLKNIISAINTGAFGLGSILGPILGSVLESSVNYRVAFGIITVPVFIITCIQLFSAFIFKKKEDKKIQKRITDSESDDMQMNMIDQRSS